MQISPVQKTLINIRNTVTSPKMAEFARNTVCAIAVETTLKATGRPAFIYYDKHANKQSKKYAATKELLYQSFCLGLYLSLINKFKNKTYQFISKRFAQKNPEDKRKLDLYDSFQNKIQAEKDKTSKKELEKQFSKLLNTNKDYHFGKGVKEFSSIVSTVFILAICAPIASQIILHPVMDLIFKDKSHTKSAQNAETQPIQ